MPYTKIIESGDLVEVFEYEKEPIPYEQRKQRKKRTGVSDYKQVIRRADNLDRLKKRFIRLVRANCTANERAVLFTLTMLEIVGVDEASRAINVFFQRLRKLAKRDIRYISVLEFQKRGAIHYHAIVWGIQKRLIRDEKRNRDIQRLWGQGFVDCLSTDGSPRLAGYLAKYLSKSMQDQRLFQKRAYNSSRNVLRPVQTSLSEEFDSVSEYFELSTALTLQTREFRSEWLGKGRYRLFKKK